MTPWVRRLLIANVVVYFVAGAVPALYDYGAFRGDLVLTRPWSLVSYQFLHAGFMHILFNMIGLYFFGPRLEQRMGARPFLILYFVSGISGAVLSIVFTPTAWIVGASGAVYGVVAAFATIWPNERIYLYAIIPVPAWALATFAVAFSLQSGISGAQDGTAHFAHLGGLVFGVAYLKWWEFRRGADLRSFQKKMQMPSGDGSNPLRDRGAVARWEKIDVSDLHEINRSEVAQLMERVRSEGASILTTSERQFLDRMAGR